jgi:regulator of replication initiation timing
MKQELQNDIDELKAIIKSLSERIEKLEAENAELRSRLSLNSENSHKPPSTDGLSKKPALPKPKISNNGGQKGHKGNTLKQVSVPDVIVSHPPET